MDLGTATTQQGTCRGVQSISMLQPGYLRQVLDASIADSTQTHTCSHS